MPKLERLKVSEVAKMLHTNSRYICIGLRTGIMNFGWAVPPAEGKIKYNYIILKSLFEKETGINVDEWRKENQSKVETINFRKEAKI